MRRWLLLLFAVCAAAWVAIPAGHVAELVERHGGNRLTFPAGLPAHSVTFPATDGTRLEGWLVAAPINAPTVVLVPGFKSDRISMLPYARLLYAGGFTVLLYDSRGTGNSGGQFAFGAREVDDVLGAVRYARRLRPRSRVGLLGVSIGAGDVIVAAARDRHVSATVADSAYVDQVTLMQGLERLHVGRFAIPLAPVATFVADYLTQTSVESFRPVAGVSRIAPGHLLLIHSRHDTNPTTPLAGAFALLRASRGAAELWVAPRGDHGGALAAQPREYQSRVTAFFRRFLRRPRPATSSRVDHDVRRYVAAREEHAEPPVGDLSELRAVGRQFLDAAQVVAIFRIRHAPCFRDIEVAEPIPAQRHPI